MQNNAFGSTTEETVSQKLFDLSGIQLFDNDHGTVSFQEMCGWINDSTIETCLTTLRNITEQRTDWAMEGTNVYLLNKAKAQIGYALSPDEQVLFFKDSGIFANGKSGVLITNKTLYNFSKKAYINCPLRTFSPFTHWRLLLVPVNGTSMQIKNGRLTI